MAASNPSTDVLGFRQALAESRLTLGGNYGALANDVAVTDAGSNAALSFAHCGSPECESGLFRVVSLQEKAMTITVMGAGQTSSGTVLGDGDVQKVRGTASGTKLMFVAHAMVHSGSVAVNLVEDTPSGDVVDDGTLAFTGSGTFREPGFIRGNGALVVSGPGTTVVLDPLTDLPGNYNTYVGGTRIEVGVLDLAAPRAAGTGPTTFIHDQGSATGTLRIEPGAAPANIISGFMPDGHGGTDLTVVPASPSTGA